MENVIFGIHPITEAINAGKKIEKILFKKELDNPQLKFLMEMARQNDIAVQFVPIEKIAHVAKGGLHQGVVAYMAQIEYADMEVAMAKAFDRSDSPIVLLLDGVSDVRNLGAITRTAECAGVDVLFVPAKGGAAVNSEAIKSSSGALLRVPVCKVPNLKMAIFYLKESGFKVIGATEKTDTLIYKADYSGPIAIVMGAEGTGISSSVIALCDQLVRIPMAGSISSLNVGVASAIVLYEAVRQRGADKL